MSENEPIDGRWYWVHLPMDEMGRQLGETEESQWFPAVADSKAAGGWTNQDTWENFRGAVDDWSGPIERVRHRSWEGHEQELLAQDGTGSLLLDPARSRSEQQVVVDRLVATMGWKR